MTNFSWLHLTDFHQGMNEQDWLWPGFKAKFFEDLKLLNEKWGGLDLVLFTGDITQNGSNEEFTKFNEFIHELWNMFDCLKISPKFLAVPGNHDLVRPQKEKADLLRDWSKKSSKDQSISWNSNEIPYKSTVEEAFENYFNWWKNVDSDLLPNDLNTGIVTGDFSVTFNKEDAELGIVGLNTSFIQLSKDIKKGALAFHPKQFHSVCNDNAPAWVKLHHACILLTHHPPQWMNQASQKILRQEITANGQFQAHLCGHMHKTVYQNIEEGSSSARCLWQSPSLFGLKYYQTEEGGSEMDRSLGYTVGRIEIESKKEGNLLFIPRKEYLQQGDERNIVPNYSLNLTKCFPSTQSNKFSLTKSYEGPIISSDTLQERFDQGKNIATSISNQHKDLKYWKQIHEDMQILSIELSQFCCRMVEGIWKTRPRYEYLMRNAKNNWPYLKIQIERIVEENENYIENNIASPSNFKQDWMISKQEEYENKTYDLREALKAVDEIFIEWISPTKVDKKGELLTSRLNNIVHKTNEYLATVDSTLKEEMSFFESDMENLLELFDLDI